MHYRGHPGATQQLDFNKVAATDNVELAKTMPGLAKEMMAIYRDEDRERYLNNLFRLQIIAEQYAEANATLRSLRDILKANDPVYANVTYTQYEIFSNAKLIQSAKKISFEEAFKQSFRDTFGKLSDKEAFRVSSSFVVYDLTQAQNDLRKLLDQQKEKNSIALNDALRLARNISAVSGL